MKDTLPEIFPMYDNAPTPEHRLLYAILWRVIKDIFCSTKEDRRSAISFMLSPDSEKIEWSFDWVCIHLDICPKTIKNHIIEYKNNLSNSKLNNILVGR